MTTKELAEALRKKASRDNRALLDECAERLLELETIAEFFHAEYKKLDEKFLCRRCEYQYQWADHCRFCRNHNQFKPIGGDLP